MIAYVRFGSKADIRTTLPSARLWPFADRRLLGDRGQIADFRSATHEDWRDPRVDIQHHLFASRNRSSVHLSSTARSGHVSSSARGEGRLHPVTIGRVNVGRQFPGDRRGSPRHPPESKALLIHRELVGVDIHTNSATPAAVIASRRSFWAPLMRRWQSYKGRGRSSRSVRTGTAQRPLTSKRPSVLCEIEQ